MTEKVLAISLETCLDGLCENQCLSHTCCGIGVDIHGPIAIFQKRSRVLNSLERDGIHLRLDSLETDAEAEICLQKAYCILGYTSILSILGDDICPGVWEAGWKRGRS